MYFLFRQWLGIYQKICANPERAEAQKHIKELLSPGLYVNLLKIVLVVWYKCPKYHKHCVFLGLGSTSSGSALINVLAFSSTDNWEAATWRRLSLTHHNLKLRPNQQHHLTATCMLLLNWYYSALLAFHQAIQIIQALVLHWLTLVNQSSCEVLAQVDMQTYWIRSLSRDNLFQTTKVP